MSKLLDQKEALRALADGKEIQYQDCNGLFEDMDYDYNPIIRPALQWRIKVEPCEQAYSEWAHPIGQDVGEDVGEEEGFYAGWNAAESYYKSKRTKGTSNV